MDKPTLISVILATYNRKSALEVCLRALAEQDLPPDEFEVLVVDDASTDDTWDWLINLQTPFLLRAFRQTNGGAGSARNHALLAAKGHYVLFINDDTTLSSTALRQHLVAHVQAKQPLSVLGTFEYPAEMLDNAMMLCITLSSDVFAYSEMKSGSTYGYQTYWTCNISTPRDAILKAGGFDEQYQRCGFEDVDLGLRLERLDLPVLYQADIRAIHDHAMTLEDFKRRQVAYGALSVRFYRKASMPLALSGTIEDMKRRVEQHHEVVRDFESIARPLSELNFKVIASCLGTDIVEWQAKTLVMLKQAVRQISVYWWTVGQLTQLEKERISSFTELVHPSLSWPARPPVLQTGSNWLLNIPEEPTLLEVNLFQLGSLDRVVSWILRTPSSQYETMYLMDSRYSHAKIAHAKRVLIDGQGEAPVQLKKVPSSVLPVSDGLPFRIAAAPDFSSLASVKELLSGLGQDLLGRAAWEILVVTEDNELALERLQEAWEDVLGTLNADLNVSIVQASQVAGVLGVWKMAESPFPELAAQHGVVELSELRPLLEQVHRVRVRIQEAPLLGESVASLLG